jgi:hypothetical protein
VVGRDPFGWPELNAWVRVDPSDDGRKDRYLHTVISMDASLNPYGYQYSDSYILTRQPASVPIHKYTN